MLGVASVGEPAADPMSPPSPAAAAAGFGRAEPMSGDVLKKAPHDAHAIPASGSHTIAQFGQMTDWRLMVEAGVENGPTRLHRPAQPGCSTFGRRVSSFGAEILGGEFGARLDEQPFGFGTHDFACS